MFLINHFFDTLLLGQPVPDIDAANVTNAVSGTGSLGAEVTACIALWGRNPNFMLVDVSLVSWYVYEFDLTPCQSSMNMAEVPYSKSRQQQMVFNIQEPLSYLPPRPALAPHPQTAAALLVAPAPP